MIVTVLSEGKYNGILSDVIASHENCPPPPRWLRWSGDRELFCMSSERSWTTQDD